MKTVGLWVVGMLLCTSLFTIVGYCLSRKSRLLVPGRVVPAGVVLPPDWRGLRGERERQALGAAIGALLRRVDNLAADSVGRRQFDSLIAARPGLLDSAKVAERYFSLQDFLNK